MRKAIRVKDCDLDVSEEAPSTDGGIIVVYKVDSLLIRIKQKEMVDISHPIKRQIIWCFQFSDTGFL